MAIAIRLQHTGGPSVLKIEAVPEEKPGPGQVWIEQDAIGVNYLDVTQRNGSVKISLPSGLGLEAAGRVTAIGPDVEEISSGERVAYILGPLGGYASGRIYPAQRLVRLPQKLSSEDAASILFKGITAHYLLHSTYVVGPGTVMLLYGAAGALGQIMTPWAKSLGAYVIGVVSKEASLDRAKAAGCDSVLVWGKCDLASEVSKISEGKMADVVYDGVGKLTFSTSLDCLAPRGMMVSIGASSGTPDPISVATLNAKGSLFLTRPGLASHATEVAEYRTRANAVFAAVEAGTIKATAWKEFALADAAAAHDALERGQAAGAILLKPH